MYEVFPYEDARGRSPFINFLTELDQEATKSKDAKLQLQLAYLHVQRLEEDGTRTGMPHVRYLRDGIWELRPGKWRILFFHWKEGKYVLCNVFRKKGQKTPPAEIEKAKHMRQDWINRHGQ